MARSTALAGAQLAARQLNCESVFRGVLSYGRERNNAPAVSVKPRRSAQPGWPAIARTGFGCPKNAIRTMINQWIKEGKGAIKWTRLSCRTFAANAVRLQ